MRKLVRKSYTPVVPIANTCSIGYPHDGRANNAAYRHDRRADNAAYRHDRRADSLSRLVSRQNESIIPKVHFKQPGIKKFILTADPSDCLVPYHVYSITTCKNLRTCNKINLILRNSRQCHRPNYYCVTSYGACTARSITAPLKSMFLSVLMEPILEHTMRSFQL